jgi:hypothetical protein
MKRTCLTMFTAVALALPLGTSAEEGQLQTITSQTLATQPAGTPYSLSTRVGSVYSVSADVASRVRIGTITLADLARKLGITGPTLEVTMISGSRVANLPTGSVTYAASCDHTNRVCTCTKGKDCDKLGSSGLCQSTSGAAAESAPLVCGNAGAAQSGSTCACPMKTS